MWMDIAQDIDPGQLSEEDTVFDKTSTDAGKNPFEENNESEARGMLEEIDTRCGIGRWRPQWLQKFSKLYLFLGLFVFTGILQGATWAYFTSTISTIERRFKISSQTTGSIMAGNELAQILMSLILSYYGIRSKRMKFITAGVSLLSLACFYQTAPHILFGSGEFALSVTKKVYSVEYDWTNGSNINVSGRLPRDVEELNETIMAENEGERASQGVFIFPYDEGTVAGHVDLCLRDVETFPNGGNGTIDTEKCLTGDSGSSIPIAMFFVAQVISGAGTMLFLSSGGPYTDDVVMPDKVPVLFGITLALRLFGPFLGYTMASLFLRTFISSAATPSIGIDDPRWMGAWWIGWLVLGCFMAVCAALFSLFPRQMAREVLRKKSLSTDTGPGFMVLPGSVMVLSSAELKIANIVPTGANIPATLRVSLSNKINLFITFSSLFYLLAGTGYWTFLPKYIEVMFHETTPTAALFTGSYSVVFQAAGLLISGIFISKYSPTAERVSLWNVILAVVQILAFLLFTQFGCDIQDITFGHPLAKPSTVSPTTSTLITTAMSSLIPSDATSPTPEISSPFTKSIADMPMPLEFTSARGLPHYLSNCSMDCDCRLGPIIPVCDEENGILFYSPCHAGCESFKENATMFTDCSCASPNATLTKGFCQTHGGCYAGHVTFLVLTAITQFLLSTGIVGRMLIFYRSVAPEGRTLVIGLTVLFLSVFATVPGPILFGTLFDSACHVWETTCSGLIGHCWQYDNKSLRHIFNLAAAGLFLLGGVFDVLLWRKVKTKDVKLYDAEIESTPKPSTSGTQTSTDKLRTRISSSAYS